MRWSAGFKTWDRMVEQGREPPKEYYERPEIAPHLIEIWASFSELSTERQFGMTIGPIPVSKIKQYAAEEMDLEGDEANRFCTLIARMDGEYLSYKPPSKGKAAVSTDDTRGVKELFLNMQDKKRLEMKRKKT